MLIGNVPSFYIDETSNSLLELLDNFKKIRLDFSLKSFGSLSNFFNMFSKSALIDKHSPSLTGYLLDVF